jgi:hypothetical protein
LPGFASGRLQIGDSGQHQANASAPLKFPWPSDIFLNNLLASAYSIQHKQDQIRSGVSASHFQEILAIVTDTRSLLRNQNLDRDTAMNLILSRVQRVSGASGAAVCISEHGMVEYVAATGLALGLVGTSFPEAECPFFARVRTHPTVEWGPLEELKIKSRIAISFELRTPICCSGNLLGCLKLFSRLRQFNSEVTHVCELMAPFLGQLIEKQRHTISHDTAPARQEHAIEDLPPENRKVLVIPSINNEEPLSGQESKIHPKPSSHLIAADGNSRTFSSTIESGQPAHRPRFDPSVHDDEEEQLPTMDELLRQLGAIVEEGTLFEVPELVLGQSLELTPAPIAPAVVSEAPAVFPDSALPPPTEKRMTQPVLPSTPQEHRLRKGWHDDSRKLANAVPLIFPMFVLIFCASLSITQSVSMRFQALTFASIIFAVLEIWRARYGNR